MDDETQVGEVRPAPPRVPKVTRISARPGGKPIATTTNRPVLKEITNKRPASEIEERDDLDTPVRGQKKSMARPKAASKSRKARATTSKASKRRKIASDESTTDAPAEAVEAEQIEVAQEVVEQAEQVAEQPEPATLHPARTTKPQTLQPQTSAGGDDAVRRRLNTMTAKFEALEVRYSELKALSVREEESNFDKLKKHADERAAASNALINALREEIQTQTIDASTVTKLQLSNAELESTQASLQGENKSLNTRLAEAQAEIKALQIKLAASRVPDAKAPASAGITRPAINETTELRKKALKEELYSDLTGLIVRDVKREDENEVYDCIQTGRNGTLHFHLILSGSTSDEPQAYEDAEFTYSPLIDEKRDRALLELLPDYLTEEICFPRSNAAKFYSRVADCMTKRIEIVEE